MAEVMLRQHRPQSPGKHGFCPRQEKARKTKGLSHPVFLSHPRQEARQHRPQSPGKPLSHPRQEARQPPVSVSLSRLSSLLERGGPRQGRDSKLDYRPFQTPEAS